jgi:transposase
MLNEVDLQEAKKRYKNMRLNGHERLRYHALILVTNGYSYREAARILLVDEETVSRWVRQYELGGLENLKNAPDWAEEHGQRELNEEQRK